MARFELSRAEIERSSPRSRASSASRSSRRRSTSRASAFLEPLVDAFKIASGDNDFVPLLDAVAATGKPAIVSTGLTDLDAMRATRATGSRPAARRRSRCSTASAPTRRAPESAEPGGDRAARRTSSAATVGYSDHALGIDAAVAAVALGRADRREALHARPRLVGLPRPPAVRRAGRAAPSSSSACAPSSAMLGRRGRGGAARGGAAHGGRAPLDRRRARPARRPRARRRRPRPGCARATGSPRAQEGELLGRRLKRAVGAGETLTAEALE